MSALTRGLVNNINSTSLGTVASAVLPAATYGVRNFVQVHNPSASNSLAFTVDGSVPVINGNGITLIPGGSATYDNFVPLGAITVIGSAANTSYTIFYA